MKTELNILYKLYKIQSESNKEEEMIQFIVSYIPTLCDDIRILVKDKNIYVTKGDAIEYPCIIAHLDQKQKANNNIQVIRNNDFIFGYDLNEHKRVGLGADDKNGIWLALRALETFQNIKVAFFYGEEIGCIGSKACNMSFFDDCKFVIQCDRKGYGDFIIQGNGIDLNSEDFEEDCNLNQYGYKSQNGGNTDVVELKKRGLNVACCNISCGYYNQHMDTEYTIIPELLKCWEFICHILKLQKKYLHTYVAPAKTTVENKSTLSIANTSSYNIHNYFDSDNMSQKQRKKIIKYIKKHINVNYNQLYLRCKNIYQYLEDQEFELMYLHAYYELYNCYF